MTKLNETQLTRMMTTINQWSAQEVYNYLKHHPKRALPLVLTLKHYANPNSAYPVDADVLKELQPVIDCVDHPEKLVENTTLSDDEKMYFSGFMRIKLDAMANEIIRDKNISDHDLLSSVGNPPSYEEAVAQPAAGALPKQQTAAETWWNNLPEDKKNQIKNNYETLSEEQQTHLKQRVTFVYHEPIYYLDYDYVYYYQMCLIQSELDYYRYKREYELNDLLIWSLNYSIARDLTDIMLNICILSSLNRAYYGGGWGGGLSPKNTDDAKGLAAVLAVIAFVLLALAAAAASVFAVMKGAKSLFNVFTWKKPLRSLGRLLGLGVGGVGGYFAGVSIGAALGSAIPGLGTFAGAIVGAVLCTMIGAGLGALITKYVSKGLSALTNGDKFNPTNPDKWNLTPKQEQKLRNMHVNIATVKTEIKRIHTLKQKINWFTGAFPGTNSWKRKQQLNTLLEQVKKGNGIYPLCYDYEAIQANLSPIINAVPVVRKAYVPVTVVRDTYNAFDKVDVGYHNTAHTRFYGNTTAYTAVDNNPRIARQRGTDTVAYVARRQ